MFGKVRSFVKSGNLVLGYLSGLGILAMSLILFYEVIQLPDRRASCRERV